jgi:putative protease
MGQTPFILEEFHSHQEAGLTISAAALNELRRQACSQLLNALTFRPVPAQKVPWPVATGAPKQRETSLRVICNTLEQVQVAAPMDAILIVPPKLVPAGLELAQPERIFVTLPRWDSSNPQLAKMQTLGIRHLLCDTLWQMEQGKSLGFILHGGPFLNVMNSVCAFALGQYELEDATFSLELSRQEALDIHVPIPMGWEAGGHTPMMLLRRCPFSEVCKQGKACPTFLIDRQGRQLRVLCTGDSRELLNPDILWLADVLPPKAAFLTLRLSTESALETRQLLDALVARRESPVKPFTRGCFRRGVE